MPMIIDFFAAFVSMEWRYFNYVMEANEALRKSDIETFSSPWLALTKRLSEWNSIAALPSSRVAPR